MRPLSPLIACMGPSMSFSHENEEWETLTCASARHESTQESLRQSQARNLGVSATGDKFHVYKYRTGSSHSS